MIWNTTTTPSAITGPAASFPWTSATSSPRICHVQAMGGQTTLLALPLCGGGCRLRRVVEVTDYSPDNGMNSNSVHFIVTMSEPEYLLVID